MAPWIAGTSTILTSDTFHCAPSAAAPAVVMRSTTCAGGIPGGMIGAGRGGGACARYANQEFFTEAQRAEIDRARSELLGRERRAERGTERDVSGSYNNVFVSFKRTGARTSLIVDPPNGRIPPLTPEA